MLDFTRRKEAMDAGIAAAREALPRIRAAIDALKARKAAEAVPRG
jgi:NTE family protein